MPPIRVLIVLGLLLLCACVVPERFRRTGVELEPLTDGWEHDLTVETNRAAPVQYRRVSRGVEIEVFCYAYEEPRLMITVTNLGRQHVSVRRPASLRHPVKERSADTGFASSWVGRLYDPAAQERAGSWHLLNVDGHTTYWVANVEWASDPRQDDRIESALEFQSGGELWTIPIQFRVARVYDKR